MSSRSLLREIAEQLEATAEGDPRFWTGLREELGRARMARGTRQYQASQTAGPITDVGVQVAPVIKERATQTGGPPDDSDNSSFSEEPEESSVSAVTDSTAPDGCRNCVAGTIFIASVIDPARSSSATGATVRAPL
jgi:hypothetical protein